MQKEMRLKPMEVALMQKVLEQLGVIIVMQKVRVLLLSKITVMLKEIKQKLKAQEHMLKVIKL